MIRSSFLSRIKEIGVLRAIGVKKADVYRMFIGEIFAITTIAGMPGILLMTYILYNAAKISYFEGMFVVNTATFITSIALVYAFNLIVGVLPIYKVLKKRPAQILSRHDI
jgi:ABC-type antimicrobial peptide transport system permease subunit